jgi:hypothetical protein
VSRTSRPHRGIDTNDPEQTFAAEFAFRKQSFRVTSARDPEHSRRFKPQQVTNAGVHAEGALRHYGLHFSVVMIEMSNGPRARMFREALQLVPKSLKGAFLKASLPELSD